MLSSLTHKLFGVTYSKTERGGKGGKESRLSDPSFFFFSDRLKIVFSKVFTVVSRY